MATNFLPESIKKHVPVIIAVAMTFFFVVLAFEHADLTDSSFLTRIEFRWIDTKFQIRGEQAPAKDVVLVGIDDKTLHALGSFRTMRHGQYATLVDKLSEAKPKVIGFDMVFPDADLANPDDDRKFAESMARAGNVILGMWLDLASSSQTTEIHETTPMTPELEKLVIDKQVFAVDDNSRGVVRRTSEFIKGMTLQLNLPELTRSSRSFGFVNFHPDAEGRLRHQPQFIDYQGNLYPSLDLQLLRAYLNAESNKILANGEQIVGIQVGKYTIPTDRYGRYMLNFNGKGGAYPLVSMIDVMEGRVDPGMLKDKIVLVGPEAIGLGDIRPTPFDPVMPGMELHANVIDNVLTQRYLYRTANIQFIDIGIILIIGVLLGVFLPGMNATRSLSYSALMLAAFTALNILSFVKLHWVMGYVYPGMALVVISGGMISWKYLVEERAKQKTRQTFQYYLDPHVIEQVMNQPDMLKLGGEKREMSVLFSDIRSFTSFSEKMAPTEVVHFLNQYFDKMTGLIFQYKGTLDKLIGDAVMCFWGHPINTKDHAVRATLTALEMIQAVEDLRPVLILPGGARFEIGIGVNSGPMVAGNMGSKNRFSYTVMGDNVNLGARLEALNKYYGTSILISDSTYQDCKHLILCRELDTIQVKGKSQAVTIYEPLGTYPPRSDRRFVDRRGADTPAKKARRAVIISRFGERRREERRLGSDRLAFTAEQKEVATMYGHALSLYRKGDFDAAEMAFDHVLTLSPRDGPSKLMKGRISKYRVEYAGAGSHFDPIYKFDEK